MSDFISRAKIEHYVEVLHELDMAPNKRATIVRLLLEEEDKLSKFQGQLEFADGLAARGRELLNQTQARLNKSKHLTDQAEAVRRLSNLKSIQHLLDRFCHQLRSTTNSAP